MSARKSFDVPRKAAVRKAAPPATPARRKKAAAPKKPAPRVRESTLRQRRRDERNRLLWIWVILVGVVVGGVIYGLWRPEVRISSIESEEYLKVIAEEELSGTYWHILPRDSIFFYPERDIRQAVLEALPAVSAVSISRSSLTSLSLSAVERSVAFWWCGTPESATAAVDTCYEADAEGLIFRPALVDENASSTPSGSTLRIYANLLDATNTPQYPLRARMESLEAIPDALRFVKAMKELGVSPVSIAIRGDEADLFIPSSGRGTRITYVLGREEAAAELATAVFPTLSLTDGSVEYVDLRFSGKAYVKRRE